MSSYCIREQYRVKHALRRATSGRRTGVEGIGRACDPHDGPPIRTLGGRGAKEAGDTGSEADAASRPWPASGLRARSPLAIFRSSAPSLTLFRHRIPGERNLTSLCPPSLWSGGAVPGPPRLLGDPSRATVIKDTDRRGALNYGRHLREKGVCPVESAPCAETRSCPELFPRACAERPARLVTRVRTRARGVPRSHGSRGRRAAAERRVRCTRSR